MLKEESRCFIPAQQKKEGKKSAPACCRGCATGVRLAVGGAYLAVAATYFVNAVVIPAVLYIGMLHPNALSA
jgi:hypothetical protein